MVKHSGDLAEQGSDPLGSLGNLNVQELLDGQTEALLVGHHGDVVQTVKVGQRLQICLVLNQLLGTTVQQTDMRVGTDDLFTVQLENQTQHTVGGGVLRAEVDRVVSHLALRQVVVARLASLAQVRRVLLNGPPEVGVDGNEARDMAVVDWRGKVS